MTDFHVRLQNKLCSKDFFIKIDYQNGGKLKFEFFQLYIFEFLSEELGFCYAKINGKGKFLKTAPNGFIAVKFHRLRDEFTQHLNCICSSSNLPDGISYEDYMDKYYAKMPITKTYARSFFQSKKKLNEDDFVIEGEFLKYK